MKIKLIDGTELNNIKIEINFPLSEEFDEKRVEIHLQGDIVEMGGWYSNVISLEELSSILVEDDLVKVKFFLAKMNGCLRI